MNADNIISNGSSTTWVEVFVLLGANLGERADNLEQARQHIGRLDDTRIVSQSGLYESPAEGMPPQTPRFLNQAVRLQTALGPRPLLDRLELIERKLGRTEKGVNSSRQIDIDILLWGDLVGTHDGVILPHPRLVTRGFALIPLAEIAPDLRYPASGATLADYITDRMRTQTLPYTASERHIPA